MRQLISILLCLSAFAASAVPAKPGAVAKVTQPDGTVVQLTVHGDERHHHYMTIDGKPVIAANDGYFYATLSECGKAVKSDLFAHDPANRNAGECAFLDDIDEAAVCKAIFTDTSTRLNATHDGVGTSSPGYPTTGQRKGLVLLVQYEDVEFEIDDAYDYFQRMLNEEGFSLWGGTGSCRDYFIASSNGLYTPDFDVYGPITLPNPRSYYGGNDAAGNDKYPHHMPIHAARIIDEEVDFSQYDLDGDYYVDYMFLFYAGEGESSGGGEDTVWPHSWSCYTNEPFDGVWLNKYACAPEIAHDSTPDGIGTFVHEFCHVLGLPDLYNTQNPNAAYTPSTWSVLDTGCYNNDARTPPSLSAFERNALGWMGDLLYEPKDAGTYSLGSLVAGNEAILLSTADDNEFFILENRQNEGWDSYLPYHGMLVWHIDYDRNTWYANTPNNNADHQRVDIVEACGRTYSTDKGKRRYPFPGYEAVTALHYGGSPSLEDWTGNDIGYALTDISENNGVVTFQLSGAAGVDDATISDSKGWVIDGNRLLSNDSVTVTDISGRIIASGSGISAILPPGLYIITTADNRTKVVVK